MAAAPRGAAQDGVFDGLVAAGVGVVVLPPAAALPAAADAANAPAAGTVVQTGPVPTLVNGSTTPADLHFDATLPKGTTGPVSARLYLDGRQFPPGGNVLWRVAAVLGTARCSANRGPFGPCIWSNSGPGPESNDIILYLPQVQADRPCTTTSGSRSGPPSSPGTGDQDLTGQIQLSGTDSGAGLAYGRFTMRYHRVANDYETTAAYAVDRSGVLWRYLGSNNTAAPFKPRVRIGGGWQAYNLITKVNATTADGVGDLVARDTSGVLWYYQGTGNPAKPFSLRVRVGGGWGHYTTIIAGGRAHDTNLLVARDAAGNLWSYAETGDISRPFAPRVLGGYGWNIYNTVTGYSSGVIGRDSAGGLWAYEPRGGGVNALYGPRVTFGHGWQIYTTII